VEIVGSGERSSARPACARGGAAKIRSCQTVERRRERATFDIVLSFKDKNFFIGIELKTAPRAVAPRALGNDSLDKPQRGREEGSPAGTEHGMDVTLRMRGVWAGVAESGYRE